MNTLYIVSTYYHALITCLKQLLSDEKIDILITDYIPEFENLGKRIEKSGLFNRVLYQGSITEYQALGVLDYIINYHKKNALQIEKQMDISLKDYEHIYIFHDDTWVAHYLKCAEIKYNLIEDGLNVFKKISKTKFRYMLHKSDLKAWIKNTFRIGYVFLGYDRNTESVEVNDIDNLEIYHLAKDKLVEVPRDTLFKSLDDFSIEILKNIFWHDIPNMDFSKSTLLLTQPLFSDGYVNSESEQLSFYKGLVDKYVDYEQLVIKSNPRDLIDYSQLFPNAIIFDKNVPLEIIGLVLRVKFANVISVSSTSMGSIISDKYININYDSFSQT